MCNWEDCWSHILLTNFKLTLFCSQGRNRTCIFFIIQSAISCYLNLEGDALPYATWLFVIFEIDVGIEPTASYWELHNGIILPLRSCILTQARNVTGSVNQPFVVRRGIEPLYRELPIIHDLPSDSNRPCIQPDHFVNQKISAMAKKYHHMIRLLCMVQVPK